MCTAKGSVTKIKYNYKMNGDVNFNDCEKVMVELTRSGRVL